MVHAWSHTCTRPWHMNDHDGGLSQRLSMHCRASVVVTQRTREVLSLHAPSRKCLPAPLLQHPLHSSQTLSFVPAHHIRYCIKGGNGVRHHTIAKRDTQCTFVAVKIVSYIMMWMHTPPVWRQQPTFPFACLARRTAAAQVQNPGETHAATRCTLSHPGDKQIMRYISMYSYVTHVP